MSCPPPTFFEIINERTSRNIEIFLTIFERVDRDMCSDTFTQDQKFQLAIELLKGRKTRILGGSNNE